MKHKPWPILCLAFLHLIAPIFSLLLIYFFFELHPKAYVELLFKNKDYLSLLLHLSYPVAAFVIFTYKRWSLPVFWAIQLGAIIFNLIFIVKASQFYLYQLSLMMVGITMLNILITGYFLLPLVRQSFYDQSLHWWTTKERFVLELSAKLMTIDQKELSVTVVNISETGIFFRDDSREAYLKLEDQVELKFMLAKLPFHFSLEIIQYYESKNGYGAAFLTMTDQQKRELKSLLKALKILGLIHKRDQESRFNDFKRWFSGLFKGEGLVPSIHSKK